MNGTHPVRVRPLAIAGATAAAGYAITALIVPRSAAAGILVAFLFWSGVSIGGLTALMIHRLTGGAWGFANARAFELAAGALPFVAAFAVVIFALVPALYPWSGGTTGSVADVGRWYLNGPLFAVHSCIAFGGWFAIYLLLRLPGTAGVLAAGFGLAFHGLIIGVVGLDWIQSIEPPFFSSSFGASLAFTQLLAAFAAAAILAPVNETERATSDLGGLMLATILGLTYIDFMALLIVWYGDLPHKVIWFVRREAFPWPTIAIAMFVLVSVVPTFHLLLASVRRDRRRLRAVATTILVGIALYDVWLVGPAGSPASILTALFAIVATGAFLGALAVAGLPRALWRHAGAIHVD